MNFFKSILFFDTMITPIIFNFLYWIILACMILAGIVAIFQGQLLAGIGIIIGGTLVYRIVFEMIIIVFKNNEYLKKIAEKE